MVLVYLNLTLMPLLALSALEPIQEQLLSQVETLVVVYLQDPLASIVEEEDTLEVTPVHHHLVTRTNSRLALVLVARTQHLTLAATHSRPGEMRKKIDVNY